MVWSATDLLDCPDESAAAIVIGIIIILNLRLDIPPKDSDDTREREREPYEHTTLPRSLLAARVIG